MRSIFFSILLVALAAPVAAETTEEAVRAFGLLGTWSHNCADEKERRVRVEKDRLVLRVPSEPDEAAPYDAVRVTEEKLRVTYYEKNKPPRTEVLEKVGAKTRTAGGDLLERCLN
jgi:hypothetical protein